MSAAIPLLAPVAFGVAGAAASTLLAKTPKPPKPLPAPTRAEAAEAAARSDRTARRRGVAANLLLGRAGAESGTGQKTQLGG